MSNIEELIIRRKKENIVLNVIIIIICLISLIFFCNDFEKVLNNLKRNILMKLYIK